LTLADRLDEIAPNYWPTDYVRAQSQYGLGNFSLALQFANQQISKRPSMLDAYKIKVLSLAKLDSCNQMERLKDSLLADTPELIRECKSYLQPIPDKSAGAGGLKGRVTAAMSGILSRLHRHDEARSISRHKLEDKINNLRCIKEAACLSQKPKQPQ
jgi:hypothetical protein